MHSQIIIWIQLKTNPGCMFSDCKQKRSWIHFLTSVHLLSRLLDLDLEISEPAFLTPKVLMETRYTNIQCLFFLNGCEEEAARCNSVSV